MAERRIVHGDGLAWLASESLSAEHAVVTSLPDLSELPRLSFDEWRAWFVDAAEAVCRAVADDAVAIFFQTDVKRDGRWVDKSFLVQQAAERARSALLWHKVACRAPAGTATFGRPAFAHVLCFSRSLRLDPKRATADVLPGIGSMTWPKAMGLDVCDAVCAFILDDTGCRTVVDPFCGIGTVLAVANAFELSAVGVEISQKRAERARTLQLDRPRARERQQKTPSPA